jgi:hypothetical protein
MKTGFKGVKIMAFFFLHLTVCTPLFCILPRFLHLVGGSGKQPMVDVHKAARTSNGQQGEGGAPAIAPLQAVHQHPTIQYTKNQYGGNNERGA